MIKIIKRLQLFSKLAQMAIKPCWQISGEAAGWDVPEVHFWSHVFVFGSLALKSRFETMFKAMNQRFATDVKKARADMKEQKGAKGT